ncbi:MAG: hypothetical protein PHE55_12885 [Methylococcaceae bacterium]|nr:hypothetical protein [Methylococcaceae bacterium]
MPQTQNSSRLPSALLSLSVAFGAAAEAGFDETVENALNLGEGRYGKISFDARWRFENVEQKTRLTPEEANASTLRTRIGYLSPEFLGFRIFGEYSGNHLAGADEYNDGVPNRLGNLKTRFPIVADPVADVLNQGWVSFTGLPATTLKGGRQKFVLDNHRFIGDVGWRQNQQVFDSVTLSSGWIPRTQLTLAYIFGVQNIYARQVDMSSPILNVNFDTGYGKLISYGYWLDYQRASDSNQFANSTQTYGVRFDGAAPIMDGIKGLYTAEYAYQANYRRNPKHYQADYWLVEGGLDIYGLTLKGAYEELGADNGVGFTTPLATLHAFQGWADQFLATPKTGIRDLYGTLKYSWMGVDFIAMYHDFTDHNGNQDFGHEVDLLAEKKFGKHYALMVKFADFVAEGYGHDILKKTDTQKFWLQGSVSF